MNNNYRFLATATLEQLDNILSAIGTCAAVIEKNENRFSVIAANSLFVDKLFTQRMMSTTYPISLENLLPHHVLTLFNECLEKAFGFESGNDHEFPFDKDGDTTWWRYSFVPIFDVNNNVLRVFCTAIDITEKHKLKTALDNSRKKLESIIETAYDGIIVCNQQFAITHMNTSALNIFGYEKEELLNQHLDILLPPNIREKHESYITSFTQSPIKARIMQERAQVHGIKKNGCEFPAEISISKSMTERGLEFTAIIRDQTEKLQLIEQLRHEASTDYLTGLHNRRSFTDHVAKELTRSERYGRPLTFAILDLDNFKLVNDTLGHNSGDKVLQDIAEIVTSECREQDVCGRIGGEEFGLLLAETDLITAAPLLQRIRAQVERYGKQQPVPITVSAGMAERSESNNIKDFYKIADERLYHAKNTGKNSIVGLTVITN